MRKKLLSLALALCMALALLPGAAFAADSDFTIEDGVLTEYNGSGGDVVIPDGVTRIGDWAFLNCSGLTSVTIPSGVTSIGDMAFCDCSSLIRVTIPNSVTSIGNSAFGGCTGLISVTIPSGVTSIGEGAFYGCTSLTSAAIPSSVINIEPNVFGSCTCLTSITLESENTNYTLENGVLFNKNKTELLCYPAGKSDSAYTIPDSVTTIGNHAFDGCINVTSVTIPNSVTSIGEAAFNGCTGLTGVTIPSSVTSIRGSAFNNCTELTSVIIPSSVTNIGVGVFGSCTSLTSITVETGNSHFVSENGVLFNKDKTYLYCYPAGKSDSTYIIPDSVTEIVYAAFLGCINLTSVTIPSSITNISDFVFNGCTGLIDVVISSSVTSIDNGVFWSCTGLTRVTIPSSVTSIGGSAFEHCTSLTDVYYGGSEADWGQVSIDSGNEPLTNATIHYNSAAPSNPSEPSASTVGGFSDVHKGDFYDSAVLWAVNNGITNGTSGTTFSPNSSCSRAQIVTFLYRAMDGKAVTSSNPFTDVTGSGEIYDAILWALNKGITSGTTTTTFSPNVTCSRAQVVTFLWRALGNPEPKTSENSFTDVPSDGDIGTAIQWAVDKGITSGTTPTTFSPNEDCSRAQVVTFLYRAFVNA